MKGEALIQTAKDCPAASLVVSPLSFLRGQQYFPTSQANCPFLLNADPSDWLCKR